jgi:hypothetical protein
MSDEYTVEERLDGCRRALLKESIFFCIGIFLVLISFTAVMPLARGGFGTKLMFIGWLVLGGPRIIKAIFSGFGAALKSDYEVVTYQNGVKVSSDGGAQSMQINFLGRIIAAGVMFAIGGFVTLITVFILTMKYIGLHLKAKPKPAFVKSGMLIIAINVVVVIGTIIVGSVINMVGHAAQTAAYKSEYGVKTSGDFESELNETKDGRVISGYSGKGGSVIIPDTIDGLPVTGIGSTPFQGNTDVTQITLPKSLKMIERSAFNGSGLTSIVIPEGVTDIEGGAFSRCENLTSVTLPQSLQRVGMAAFSDCTELTEVNLSSGQINYVNQPIAAFRGCTKLSAASRQAIENSGYTGGF